jgi:hypothetical protein
VTGISDDVWHKGLAEIRARAVRDPAFRQRCFDDPHGVIREVCGQELPADAPPVRFAEQIKEQVFVLPPAQTASHELSERQLEDVVAGLTNLHPGYGSICWVA